MALSMTPDSDRAAVDRAAHLARGAELRALLVPAARLLLGALLLALLVRSLLVEPFAISSGSMSPGLEPGDFIFVDKSAYGWGRASLPLAPQLPGDRGTRLLAREAGYGDVVVFAIPGEQDFVKRVIARGGDRVALSAGRVILNGTPLPCVPLGGGLCRETVPGGKSHLVRETGDGALATFAEIRVPPGHYFVLGDNRDASADSRVPRSQGGVGLVSDAELLGQARRIFFSAGPGPRWERIGARID
jgi:signal peptidase I